MKKILMEIVKKLPLVVWIGMLSIASWGFAVRMSSRNQGSYVRSRRSEVMTNWGANLDQKSPYLKSEVYYEGGIKNVEDDKVVAKNVKVGSSLVKAKIKMDSRRKGLAYFPTFVTDFEGIYKVKNESSRNVKAYLNFPLPGSGNLVWNVEVLANGSSEGAVINSRELAWSGLMKAGEEKEVVVRYAARGMEEFSYSLAESSGLQDFYLQVEVDGADRIDFPSGALSPVKSVEDSENKKWNLEWKFDKVLTSPEITVKTFAKQNISEQVAKLFWVAPLLLVAFLMAIIGLGFYRGKSVATFDNMVMSALYMVYYPLLAYVVSVFENINIYQGLAISAGVISLILGYYYRFLFDTKWALTTGVMLQVIFMAFFPVAMLIPQLTGFLVVCGVIAILGVVVKLRVER